MSEEGEGLGMRAEIETKTHEATCSFNLERDMKKPVN
jgi:hypothetical protein